MLIIYIHKSPDCWKNLFCWPKWNKYYVGCTRKNVLVIDFDKLYIWVYVKMCVWWRFVRNVLLWNILKFMTIAKVLSLNWTIVATFIYLLSQENEISFQLTDHVYIFWPKDKLLKWRFMKLFHQSWCWHSFQFKPQTRFWIHQTSIRVAAILWHFSNSF